MGKTNYSLLIGKTIGKLHVVGLGEKRGHVQFMNTICECGKEKQVSYYHLNSGHTTSCGLCIQNTDYTGMKFGRLTMLGLSHMKGRFPMWKCLCECGNEIIVSIYSILKGTTQSCGCGRLSKTKYGEYYKRFTGIYNGICKRCDQINSEPYTRYGAVGIKNLWGGLEEFKNDMYESYIEHVKLYGEKDTTIDRINFNGNYCKENCRRATNKEQARNKSTTRYITYKGETKPIKVFAEELGLNYKRVFYRLQRGRTIDRAIEDPIYTKFTSLRYIKNGEKNG